MVILSATYGYNICETTHTHTLGVCNIYPHGNNISQHILQLGGNNISYHGNKIGHHNLQLSGNNISYHGNNISQHLLEFIVVLPSTTQIIGNNICHFV